MAVKQYDATTEKSLEESQEDEDGLSLKTESSFKSNKEVMNSSSSSAGLLKKKPEI